MLYLYLLYYIFVTLCCAFNGLYVAVWLIIVAYILRTALMNSTNPIEEGILMDYVPKDQRARWKSLESVTTVSWCGSAAFGGFLSDRYNYTSTFIVTIVMQAIATLCYSTLITVVTDVRPEDFRKGSSTRAADDEAEICHNGLANN